VTDPEVLDAFALLARTEGIIPALESAHALAWISRERGKLVGKVVLVNMSGRGDKDVEQVARLMAEAGGPASTGGSGS
jgi:tryptophan synthase beta chain